MDNIFFSNNYAFKNYIFETYHHTDETDGVYYHFFAYMNDGRCDIISDNEKISVKKGDVFYIPKNLRYHSYWYGEKIDFMSYGFLYMPVSENVDFKLQKINCDEKTKKLLLNITTGNVINSKSLSEFYTAMTALLPLMEKRTANKEKVITDNAKKFIHENPNCTISQIAEHCCICEATLYTAFKKELNTTPNQIKQKMLIDKAVTMLTTTDKPIEEISNILNFSSSSYFRKIFKSFMKKTPKEIRKTSVF